MRICVRAQAVLRPWMLVCVCVCFATNSDPSAEVNQTINLPILSNISNTAKAGWA